MALKSIIFDVHDGKLWRLQEKKRKNQEVRDNGTTEQEQEEQQKQYDEILIGNQIDLIGFIRNKQNAQWEAILHSRTNVDNTPINYRLPMGKINDIRNTWAEDLGNLCYIIEDNETLNLKTYLKGLITSEDSNKFPRFRSVEKLGWNIDEGRHCFVLPTMGDTIGAKDVILDHQPQEQLYTTSGTFEEWQEIARLAEGNSKFMFALSIAFAGPLLSLLEAETFGFNFEGPSSCGKTTALQLCASVAGSPSLKSWRLTDNALESVAELSNDGTLALDELGLVDGIKLDQIIYMVSQGAGKLRAKSQKTELRPTKTWRLVLISSGELGASAKLEEVGKTAKAGQEVRFIGIPCQASDVKNLHGYGTSEELVSAIKQKISKNFGHSFRRYIKYLIDSRKDQDYCESLKNQWKAIEQELKKVDAHPQVQRATKHFALVQLAGELATGAGCLPFDTASIGVAVRECLEAWISGRGGTGSVEDKELVESVRRFILSNSQSSFQDLDGSDKQYLQRRVGFVRRGGPSSETVYYFFKEHFEKELLKGKGKQGLKLLANAGLLIPQKNGQQNGKSIITYGQYLQIPSSKEKYKVYAFHLNNDDGTTSEDL